MTSTRRRAQLKLGDRARSKLNRRVGTVDAIDKISNRRQYGLHYDEPPRISTSEEPTATVPSSHPN